MAQGVDNASIFLPLMTPEYAASDNCKREYVNLSSPLSKMKVSNQCMIRCTAAASKRIPMVPLRLANFTPEGTLFNWLI
jgi:hypothetical protein